MQQLTLIPTPEHRPSSAVTSDVIDGSDDSIAPWHVRVLWPGLPQIPKDGAFVRALPTRSRLGRVSCINCGRWPSDPINPLLLVQSAIPLYVRMSF